MLRFFVFVLFLLVMPAVARADAVRVLIIDDVFVNVPAENETLQRMGSIHGDLFVNGNHYLGDIVVWEGKDGLYLVNRLPLEEYVKNVVSVEAGIDWDIEALKVQAVISRTYALYNMLHSGNVIYDLTSSVLHQAYKSSAIDSKISYAVDKTRGEVLTYKGDIIESFYHSTCGGRTENPEEVFGRSYPYMKSVESNCEISPYWVWQRKIPLEEIEKKLSIPDIKEVTINSYTSTNRVKTIRIVSRKGSSIVKATELRKLLGWKRLPSTKFSIYQENDSVLFEGSGYGHGVGLCQWSALKMASNGLNYKEILSFFYPGTSIQLYENR